MTDVYDAELRRRLEGLAGAVPVDPAGGLVPVAASVNPGRATRRVAAGLLVPVALVALLAVVVSSGTGHRPKVTPGPRESPTVDNGPVETTDLDGAFELTVRSAHARYGAGEPIDVQGSLTYHGAEATVEICTDSGPILFGIREKVLGGITLEPVSRLMFDHSSLMRDVPLTKPFTKSGGFSGDDPAAASFQAFFADPILRLLPGTWHLYATSVSCAPPGPLHFNLMAEIEIFVDDAPIATPSRPTQSPSGAEVQIRTAAKPNTSGECMTARLGGTLAPNPRSGLGVEAGGVVMQVIWPFGWTARRDGDDVLLFDETGGLVARTGDQVAFAGGMVSRPTGPPEASTLMEDAFAVCGGSIE